MAYLMCFEHDMTFWRAVTTLRQYSACLGSSLSPVAPCPAAQRWSSCGRAPPRPAAPRPGWGSRPALSPDWWRHSPVAAPPPPSRPAARPPVNHVSPSLVWWYSLLSLLTTRIWQDRCNVNMYQDDVASSDQIKLNPIIPMQRHNRSFEI